jgi:hypothetical protein
VESLPVLKYSYRLEDQVAAKFIAWKEKLYQYVQNDGNYSAKVATIFEGQNPAAEQLPNPPDGNDPPWHEKEAWKDGRKRVKDRNDKLVDDKKKVYALMMCRSKI